jgi:hypothetical protein
MTRLPLVSLSLAAVTLFAVVPAVQADLVTDVTNFTGTVTDVGVVRGPGQTGGVEYRIHGEFTSPLEITMKTSTFLIEKFFYEPDGAGELMRASQGPGGPETDPLLAPITLPATQGDLDDVTYNTPGRFRPQIKAKIERGTVAVNGQFNYKFDVRLDRGMMRTRPILCALESDGRTRTLISISFTITDSNAHPLIVSFTKPWECTQPDRYHMRAR